MTMIKCVECAALISDRAKACPNCGAPVPRSGLPWWGWLLVAPVAILGAMFVIGAMTPAGSVRASLAREQCEKDRAAEIFGNPRLCDEIAEQARKSDGCPADAPGCSWGRK